MSDENEVNLDQAVSDYAELMFPDDGPVIAWALVMATDADGDTSPPFSVITAPGQRGFVTVGLLHEALASSQAGYVLADEGDEDD